MSYFGPNATHRDAYASPPDNYSNKSAYIHLELKCPSQEGDYEVRSTATKFQVSRIL